MSRSSWSLVLAVCLLGCGGRIVDDSRAVVEDAATGVAVDSADAGEIAEPVPSPKLVADGSGGFQIMAMVLTANDVVWSRLGLSGDDYEVLKVAKGGGPIAKLAAAPTFIGAIAADESRVYYTQSGPCCGNSLVWSVPLTGGAPVALATREYEPDSIAVNASAVFWTAHRDVGEIVRADRDGTNRRVVLADLRGVARLRVAGEFLFFTTASADGSTQLVRTSLEGSDRAVLASTSGSGLHFAVAGRTVGFMYGPAGEFRLASVDVMGGPIRALQLWKTYEAGPHAVALDGSRVYFRAPGALLQSASLTDPGSVATLVPDAPGEVIAVDDTRVFWAHLLDNRILSLVKR